MQILECRNIRERELSRLKYEMDKKLSLAVIQIGNFLENKIYLRSKKKLAQELGIDLLEINYQESTSKEEIINKILELNIDSKIKSIMIQRPILEQFNYQELINYIDYQKDVEGLTTTNKSLLASGLPFIIPCTARAVLKVLEEYQISLVNRKISIIGKSDLVGMPLYYILKKDNLVTLCDSKTENLKKITLNSDIVITAIGRANYFTKEYFRDGQVIIDVGTNYLDGKLVGDVNLEEVKNLNIMITPVPSGIGQLTPIYLYRNLLELIDKK